MIKTYVYKLFGASRILIFCLLISTGAQTKAELLPDIDLFDIELPDIELPDIDLSDVELSDLHIINLLEKGPSWFPKSYKIPLSQGSMSAAENFSKLEPGLSREQVKFLLGTPTLVDVFRDDRWEYMFFEKKEGTISKVKE